MVPKLATCKTINAQNHDELPKEFFRKGSILRNQPWHRGARLSQNSHLAIAIGKSRRRKISTISNFLKRTDDQIVKFQERETTQFTAANNSSCKVCGRGDNCADVTATCSSNNGFCSEVFGNDGTLIESNCGSNLQALDWDNGVRSKTEWFQLETCGNSESCNRPGSEEQYMPTAECTPSSAISFLVSVTTFITLLFI